MGSGGAITTEVASISVNNTGTNNIEILETDAINVVELDNDAATGTVTLNAGGDITVLDAGSTGLGVSALAGMITLDAVNLNSDVFVNNTVSTPNGIVFDGENNRLIFVNWGSNAAIKAVDLSNNSVSTIITTNLGNIDGIDDDNDGNYYISSWSPARITKYDKDFVNPPEIISTPFMFQMQQMKK